MTIPTVRRTSAAVLGVLLAVGGSALTAPAAAAPPARTAVIVQLTPGSDAAAESRRAAANGGSVSHVYTEVFRGFAGSFSDRAIENMRRNPNVALIEHDGEASIVGAGVQTDATWGLDRIDERALASDGSSYDRTYDYPASGEGVTAYIIDTGINAGHEEFTGRVTPGYDSVEKDFTTEDCNGHGTHVAGTVGGDDYGAAQTVSLVAVRVLDCAGSGTWSGVIAGLDWVRGHHVAGQAVANMSLGGGRNNSVDTAVKNLVADGVTVVVAAGNSNANACNYSPARVPEAITVGATDSTDRRASFSNFGSCLDLFAPGVGITSAWIGSTAATDTISGTSMAAPHVAGAAAVLLDQVALLPSAVATELIEVSTKNVVGNAGRKSPDRLLYVTKYTG